MERKKRCELCVFWALIDGEKEAGCCHHGAPVPTATRSHSLNPTAFDHPYFIVSWPVTYCDDWCREWCGKDEI